MNRWYVIQTKPLKENHVATLFKLAGLETFNPKIKSFANGLRPLFPNYLFLRWDLERAVNYHLVRYTRGVSKVLGLGGLPFPISDAVVEVIQNRVNQDQILEQQTLKVGARVRVKTGLLRDLEGVLEKPVSADGRVAVLIQLYEREMKAVLSAKDITLAA